MHNLFGLLEARITAEALTDIRGERLSSCRGRPSRRTVRTRRTGRRQRRDLGRPPGVTVTVMNMNLFGIPMIGSDMRFPDNTTGAVRALDGARFPPFSRNHNTIGAARRSRTPESVAAVARRWGCATACPISTRSLTARTRRRLAVKPLWASFGADAVAHSLDGQFLGDGILFPALRRANLRLCLLSDDSQRHDGLVQFRFR